MSNTIIQVENVGKQYRLGQVGTGTISHDINRWWHKVRGKEDPYLKVGEVNDRTIKGSDLIWALKDINFEVKRGEVLGIIGKNGAGKSTLLKILSRVTGPSVGNIKVKGRIAALLEVGTGFHPELSGRENIFLNGAILGMSKQEIKRKFDEIVDFSGVERYIDTPVKRYSSGMYVRLAFAVAAHLEPEILIVDEVLAVGDADFQKKCLGKMKDVSGQGRTVLFVSHNMEAISKLCNTGVYLKHGQVSEIGSIDDVVSNYLKEGQKQNNSFVDLNKYNKTASYNNNSILFLDINFKNSLQDTNIYNWDQPIVLTLKFKVLTPLKNVALAFTIATVTSVNLFTSNNIGNEYKHLDIGTYEAEVKIHHNLRVGSYFLHFGALNNGVDIWWHTDICNFSITSNANYPSNNAGLVNCKSDWTLNNI
jgi:lipopolysaccharide transport system ATP-binding protein